MPSITKGRSCCPGPFPPLPNEPYKCEMTRRIEICHTHSWGKGSQPQSFGLFSNSRYPDKWRFADGFLAHTQQAFALPREVGKGAPGPNGEPRKGHLIPMAVEYHGIPTERMTTNFLFNWRSACIKVIKGVFQHADVFQGRAVRPSLVWRPCSNAQDAFCARKVDVSLCIMKTLTSRPALFARTQWKVLNVFDFATLHYG